MTLPWLCILCISACSRSNNLLLGTVEALVGDHRVTVTDCYRLHVASREEIKESNGQISYRFTPCRDADVLIRNDELIVNSRQYGHISPGESVLIDHGAVSIRHSTTRSGAPAIVAGASRRGPSNQCCRSPEPGRIAGRIIPRQWFTHLRLNVELYYFEAIGAPSFSRREAVSL